MHSSYWDLERERFLKPNPGAYSERNFASAQPLAFCTYEQHDAIPEGGVQVSPRKWVCAKCWPYFIKKKKPKK